MIARRTQRIKVGARVGVALGAWVLFERGVGRGADTPQCQRRILTACSQQLDQPEVYQLDDTIGRQDDIARLDVAMDDRRWTLAM